MGFKIQQLNTQTKENLEKAFFCKDYVQYLPLIYIMLHIIRITCLKITDNILILDLEICLYWVQEKIKKGHASKRLYTSYTAYLHKGTNRPSPQILSAANSVY